ncbi:MULTISPECIES: methyl-accepting chemotaxis protein [Bacillus]|uniref:methyl-accepting chemotaxis protein n=1 Tax=Bacillus TaxID=1386 RepID=UPI00036491CE|nr:MULTISPECIES: methyl-accepting chemotaxis protein [Bacillus]
MKNKYLSFRTKLLILCISIIIIPVIIISISSYSISKNQLNDIGKNELKTRSKSVIGMIDILNDEVKKGNITLEEAQEKLRLELFGEKDAEGNRPLNPDYTSGKAGYIIALNEQAVSVMSFNGEGVDYSNKKTPDGVLIGQEFLKKGEKGGFIEYEWLNPTSNKTEKKITYVQKDPHWGWIIGSTGYLSDYSAGANKIAYTIAIISIISIIIFSLDAIFFARRFIKPITRVSNELALTAEGDFSREDVKIAFKDEIGTLTNDFNKMKNNMKQLIYKLAQTTEQVASASEQLTASAKETSKATNDISISIQRIATGAEMSNNGIVESAQSLEEVSLAIQNLAENSSELSEQGTRIVKQANKGNEYVSNTVAQIKSIHQKVMDSNEVLKLLDTRSNEINDISHIITNIAEQTNLLALNAAIEAARAGENGNGFAVVADEVRKLAEQSQQSSNQISTLIKEIQFNMTQSTESMNQVELETIEGLELVHKTETSFKEISNNMYHMEERITEMAATVEQMSASAEEVSATITNISESTKDASAQTQLVAASAEQQLSSMEEIALSANSLSNLATGLQEQVKSFKL